VANRTQIVCLHEGEKGRSIDPLFIRSLLKQLSPAWIMPWPGNNVVRTVACEGRSKLMEDMSGELKLCLARGGDTTLMVWADVDDDMADCEALKEAFWKEAQAKGITRVQFDTVVFAFARDRIENWIEFLNTGTTDESKEGPRVKHGKEAADAAKTLAAKCLSGAPIPSIPPSLEWSCKNWEKLKKRMKR
jgi:hypothetical protein